MSVNLTKVLNDIQNEKTNKLKPQNIRYGEKVLGVQGTLRPVQIDGGDIGLAIYAQDNTPEANQGIWLKTDKTWDKIYLENDNYNTDYKILFSNDTTLDPGDTSNIILGRTVPVDLLNCDYCQRGNVAHFFGYWSYTESENTTAKIHQHYTYDFDTDTWTQLSACPTPQGGGGCVWVDDDTIYIIGSAHIGYDNYLYKYTISTDTWEQITGLLDDLVGYSTDRYDGTARAFIDACYDNDRGVIYFARCRSCWKYDFVNGTVTYLCVSKYCNNSNSWNISTSSSSGFTEVGRKYGLYYNSDKLHFSCQQGYYPKSKGYYDIINNSYGWSFSNTSTSYNTVNRYLNNISVFLYSETAYSHDSYVANIGDSTIRTISSSGTPFSDIRCFGYAYPLLYIRNDNYDMLLSMYGTDASSMSALTLNDKSYDFETNTLIINTRDGLIEGAYKTEIYRNEKVLNGVIYNRFNDVNLYDATQNKLIKDIETYYGNGTDWIKIK